MADVFDQLPDMAPKADVFDQITAPKPAEGPQSFGAIHNAINAGFSGINSLANLGVRALGETGIVSPERAQQAMAVNPLPYDPTRTSGKIGSAVGNFAEAAMAPTLAPALFAAQGGENAIENVEKQVASGQNVSTGGAIANVAGNAGLQAGMAMLAPGGGASKGLIGLTPTLENGLLNAGKNALVAAGVGYPEGVAQQVGANAIDRYSGVDPNRGLMQGANEAGLTNALGAGVGQGLHEGMNALSAAGGRVNAAASKGDVFDQIAPQEDADTQQVKNVQFKLGPGSTEPVPEFTSPPRPREAEHAKPPRETEGFEKGEEIPTDEEGAKEAEGFFHRIRAAQDRRVSTDNSGGIGPGDTDRRVGEERRDFTDAKFETPEEAGANRFFSDRREANTEPGLLSRIGARAKELIGSESGSATGAQALLHQDIVPAVKFAVEKTKQTLTDIDKAFHGGFTDTPEAKNTSLNIRQSMGEAENAGHKFEAAVKPFREAVPSFSKDGKAAMQWADDVEAGGDGGVKEAAPVVDLIRQKRTENAERAKALGIKNLDEEGLGLSRLAEFPDSKSGGGSLAGTNAPFLRQKFNTFSEFADAVEKAGGKMKYDNPVDMQIARQYEVEKNLAARENLRAAEKAGTAEWVKEGDQPTEGHEKIKDPIIGSEERRMALPKWMVGKFSGLEGFEAHKFLDDHANDMVPVRPGEDPPQGYSFTPRSEKGSFHMTPDAAARYNNLLPSQPHDPLTNLVKNAAGAAVKFRYDANLTHATNAVVSGAIRQFANGFGRVMHGEMGAAAKSFADMATGGYLKGRALRKNLEAGTAGEVGERVMAANPDLNLKSVTDKSWINDVKEKYNDKNPYGAVWSSVKGVFGMMHDATFKHVLPSILAGHAATVAENQISRGISKEAGRADLANEVDTLSKLIGHHLQSPEYQKNIARDIAGVIVPAARFWEGQARAAGSIAHGNKAAMAFFASGTVLTAGVGAAIQAALTYHNTGNAIMPTSLRDCLNPLTGNKDQNGNDERLALPGPISKAYRIVTEPGSEVKASLHPAIQGTIDTVQNRDYLGNQVRPDDASTSENIKRGAIHILKGALPMQTPDLYESPDARPKTMGDEALGMFGMRTSHPVTSQAEQTAYDILDKHSGGEGRDLAEQQSHAQEKQWIADIRAGKQQEAVEGMKQAGVTEAHARNLVKRAKEPAGLPGLLMDDKYKPTDLLSVWNQTTDAEKPGVRDSLIKRIAAAKPKNALELSAWKALQEAIK